MLSALCDMESLLKTWVRNTLESEGSEKVRGVKEAERVEDRLGVEELTTLT